MKRFVCVGLLALRAWAQVSAVQNPVAGTTGSVNTSNPSIQVSGAYAGSIPEETATTAPLSITLSNAIARALKANLSGAQFRSLLAQSEAEGRLSRSALLPNLRGDLQEVVTKRNLAAFGVRIPGAPTVVGPFNYFDLRATLTQSLFDASALASYRASRENVEAAQARLDDARDLVVFAAAGAYLQTLASAARVESAKAQVATATTLFEQASAQQKEGLLALVDANRSRVQLQTQQQRLITLENDFAKQKLNLARIIGLAPGQQFVLTDPMPADSETPLTLDSALQISLAKRHDFRAAQAALRAAELQLSSARSERLPSLSVSADYGAIGTNPGQATGTYTLAGNLRIPIWAGGRVSAEIDRAQAQLALRRAESAELRGRIDAEVRSAFLDLQSARSQIKVSEENLQVSRSNLDLTRQRFDAGIADTAEVARAQEALATAEQDVITSRFALNLAKAALARAVGDAETTVAQMFAATVSGERP